MDADSGGRGGGHRQRPTALFRLLELLADGAPRPAAVLGFPVGFVGAAESKRRAGDAGGGLGLPFMTVHGRRGGSAMAAAAVNAIAAGNTEGAPHERDRLRLRTSGTLHGVGVGPGDPELVTLRALRILDDVPVVAYPCTVSGESMALTIVDALLDPASPGPLPLLFSPARLRTIRPMIRLRCHRGASGQRRRCR